MNRASTHIWSHWLPYGSIVALVIFAASAVPTWMAVALYQSHNKRPPWTGFLRFDGQRYLQISKAGYFYYPDTQSNIAFFPGYPYTARIAARAFGVAEPMALVVLANAFLAIAFVLLAKYVTSVHDCRALDRALVREYSSRRVSQISIYALLALGLFPTSFFFRMGYSESMFLCLAIACMYGMEQSWPIAVLASLAGLATATRSVGIVLSIIVCLYAYHQRRDEPRGTLVHFLWIIPLSVWGLAVFICHQAIEFGEPLAFARTQNQWRMREHAGIPWQALLLLAWEPVWSVYDPSAAGYWRRANPDASWIVSLQFWNPILFIGSVLLTLVGKWRQWLTTRETALSLGLILIPYAARAYEMCMNSQGRFVAVAFPMYVVIARLLLCVPRWTVALLFGIAASLTGVFAYKFSNGLPFY